MQQTFHHQKGESVFAVMRASQSKRSSDEMSLIARSMNKVHFDVPLEAQIQYIYFFYNGKENTVENACLPSLW